MTAIATKKALTPAPKPKAPPKRKYLKRTPDEAIAWLREQSAHPTQSWKGLCLSSCRSAYGINPIGISANAFWASVPKEHRHYGKPSAAPRGAIMIYAIGKYGHAVIAIGKKTNDKCLSVDYVRQGRIDVAPRSFARWGARYLGWTDWTPYGFIKLA
jgi:hypothetical protein